MDFRFGFGICGVCVCVCGCACVRTLNLRHRILSGPIFFNSVKCFLSYISRTSEFGSNITKSTNVVPPPLAHIKAPRAPTTPTQLPSYPHLLTPPHYIPYPTLPALFIQITWFILKIFTKVTLNKLTMSSSDGETNPGEKFPDV